MLAVALRRIPAILSDNAGFDTQTLISELRSEHAQNHRDMGLGIYIILSSIPFYFILLYSTLFCSILLSILLYSILLLLNLAGF